MVEMSGSSLLGRDLDTMVVSFGATSSSTFDDFMRRVVEFVNVVPTVRAIGTVEYVSDLAVPSDLLVFPVIPRETRCASTDDIDIVHSILVQSDATTCSNPKKEHVTALKAIVDSTPGWLDNDQRMRLVAKLGSMQDGPRLRSLMKLLGVTVMPEESLLAQLRIAAASFETSNTQPQSGGADEIEDAAKAADADVRGRGQPLAQKAALREAHRINYVMKRLLLSDSSSSNAIARLRAQPFPAEQGEEFKKTYVKKAYMYNVTTFAIDAVHPGSVGAENEVAVKLLRINATSDGKPTPLLWCSNVSGNMVASIESAWGRVASERGGEKINNALVQHMAGRICQYLADSWRFSNESKRFVKVDVEFNAAFDSVLGERSYQVFDDLYGDRGAPTAGPNAFQETALKLQKAAALRSVIRIDVVNDVSASATLVLSGANDKGCCDASGAKPMSSRSRQPTGQESALTIKYKDYDPTYCSIVMLVFMFHAIGMGRRPPPAGATKQTSITQAALANLLKPFETKFRVQVKSVLPPYAATSRSPG